MVAIMATATVIIIMEVIGTADTMAAALLGLWQQEP
jgi:hypothetical protein